MKPWTLIEGEAHAPLRGHGFGDSRVLPIAF